jgi:phosphonopyruvate decarboxylase
MIRAASFLAASRHAGFGLASGVPCSDLGTLVTAFGAAPGFRYVGAANEGDAVAIASGAVLGGTSACVLMQNSGLGNAVNPLTSLNLVLRIPVLLVVAWRGAPVGPPDEPQHAVMGRITTGLLDLLGIPWERLPHDEPALAAAFGRAGAHLGQGTPYAFVVGKGTVEPARRITAPATTALPAVPTAVSGDPAWSRVRPARRDAIAAVQRALGPRDVLLATTGYAGREMMAGGDRPNQLAMVGSMGCAGSLALGLACSRPAHRIVVLDGDGAALMRLGALATIGYERPPNLVHVLLDNEAHDSTGGQATVAGHCDLGAIAAACGYPRVERAASSEALHAVVAGPTPELTFVHAKIASGSEPAPPRPATGPAEAAARLARWLAASSSP